MYIHIPFCRKACHYCDFHFSTGISRMQEIVDALCAEIRWYGQEETHQLNTLYFGGGTPSLLSPQQLEQLFNTIHLYFSLDQNTEVSFEVNPDDVNLQNLKHWKEIGINRLSIGIQSFQEEALRYMNRVHSATDAKNALFMAQNIGFQNITADLIYGVPGRSDQNWLDDVQTLFSFQIPHFSAYSLTVEPETPLFHLIRRKKTESPDDETAARQFIVLMELADKVGYTHYETSNFAKPGFHSRHNSGYWEQKPCIGIGPSAHGWTGEYRTINPSANNPYLLSWQQNKPAFKIETLSPRELYHEFIITALRRFRIPDVSEIKARWGENIAEKYKHKTAEVQEKFNLSIPFPERLPQDLRLFGDAITLCLMFAEDEFEA